VGTCLRHLWYFSLFSRDLASDEAREAPKSMWARTVASMALRPEQVKRARDHGACFSVLLLPFLGGLARMQVGIASELQLKPLHSRRPSNGVLQGQPMLLAKA
jgi:hypothetical protein